jgi:hypothetical protein
MRFNENRPAKPDASVGGGWGERIQFAAKADQTQAEIQVQYYERLESSRTKQITALERLHHELKQSGNR